MINSIDFDAAFTTLGLDAKQQENIFKKTEKAKTSWFKCNDISFLNDDMKRAFKTLLQDRFDRL